MTKDKFILFVNVIVYKFFSRSERLTIDLFRQFSFTFLELRRLGSCRLAFWSELTKILVFIKKFVDILILYKFRYYEEKHTKKVTSKNAKLYLWILITPQWTHWREIYDLCSTLFVKFQSLYKRSKSKVVELESLCCTYKSSTSSVQFISLQTWAEILRDM